MRIALGLILLADLLIRSMDLTVWMTAQGVMPLDLVLSKASDARLSLYFLSDALWWLIVLTLASAMAALMFTLGWHTRWATLLCFVLWASLHNRVPLILQGGDNLLLLLLFWSLWLPLGQRWSVDAALVQTPTPTTRAHTSIATAGILLQAMSVYFFSAFLKHGDPWMPDGTAIYYALSIDQFAMPMAHLWRDALWLNQPLTYYVWALELLGPLLIFLPWRNHWWRLLGVFCFVSMEIGFIFNLRIGLFPFVSITSILLFLPSTFWDWLSAKLRRPTVTMFYDEDCGFCLKTCRLLRECLLLRAHTVIKPAQSDAVAGPILQRENSWVVMNAAGQTFTKTPAMAALVDASPIFFWFAPVLRSLSWVVNLGDVIYASIARHRHQLSRLTASIMPWQQQSAPPFFFGRLGQLLALFFVLYLGWWNIATVKDWGMSPEHKEEAVRIHFPQRLNPILYGLRLDQTWNMFAPYPMRDDGWFVIPGLVASGEYVDVFHNSAMPPDFAKPDPFHDNQFENYRWRKYLQRLWQKRYSDYRQYYAKWLCRRWQATQPDDLAVFNIYYIRERTPPPGETGELTSHKLWWHVCKSDEPVAHRQRLEQQTMSDLIKLDGV